MYNTSRIDDGHGCALHIWCSNLQSNHPPSQVFHDSVDTTRAFAYAGTSSLSGKWLQRYRTTYHRLNATVVIKAMRSSRVVSARSGTYLPPLFGYEFTENGSLENMHPGVPTAMDPTGCTFSAGADNMFRFQSLSISLSRSLSLSLSL